VTAPTTENGIALSAKRLTKRNLPLVALSTLVAFNVIQATLGLALGLGAALLIIDRLGWRVVSAMFDRERLTTGSR
jgi:ABC-2 type transport system permease protein